MPGLNLSNINQSTYETIYALSVSFYENITSIDNPDLFEFKSAGGKMIVWHGLADQRIPPNGTAQYYSRFEAQDLNVRDYYRFFEVPGVQHCGGGIGPVPVDDLESVVKWVEEGIAPDTLFAVSADGLKE